jgi:hypothetical protein
MSDVTSQSLFDRAADLNRQAHKLFSEHRRIHAELLELFRKIKRLHYVAPVLGRKPPEPPPSRFD